MRLLGAAMLGETHTGSLAKDSLPCKPPLLPLRQHKFASSDEVLVEPPKNWGCCSKFYDIARNIPCATRVN